MWPICKVKYHQSDRYQSERASFRTALPVRREVQQAVKKILYIEANTDGTVGGSYYSLLYLVRGLDKLKYEPHVLFCKDNELMSEFNKVASYVYVDNFGASVNGLLKGFEGLLKWPYRFISEVLLKQIHLRKIIHRINPDLIHLNNGYAAMHEWMLAGYLNDIKVVVHDRGTPAPCSLRTRMFVRFVDAIVSVSDSFKNNVTSQHLKVKRVERVYNGLDPESFDASAVDFNSRERLRREWEIKPGQPVVGIVGNLLRWKGQLVLVEAMAKVKQVYPDVKCVIIGKTPRGSEAYEQEIRDAIVKNGLEANAVLVGYRSDIPQVLSVLDVLVHASIEPEPFGRVILEGMVSGKPIVATNGGGVPELVKHGETGLLVPMGDADEMAKAIGCYLSDVEKAREMGECGRKRASLFSVKNMVNEIEKIYADIFAEISEDRQSISRCHTR